MRLGYTDFIDKRKTKAIFIFVISILLIFIAPIECSTFLFNHNLAMRLSFYFTSVQIILYPLSIKNWYIYQLNQGYDVSNTYSEYFKTYASDYALLSIGSLIFWFTIISLIIVLIQHFKHKKICKPLLYLPLAFYIVYVIIYCAIGGSVPFVGFYLAIILEILVILYCARFQHFPKPQHRKQHERKLTDKERIANLEQRIAELERKDAE